MYFLDSLLITLFYLPFWASCSLATGPQTTRRAAMESLKLDKLPDCPQNASPTLTGADYGNSAQNETRYPIRAQSAHSIYPECGYVR